MGKERLIQITANPALTGFTASKILWVRENEPELYAQCAHILLPKDYVRYMLTGEFATEVSDASGMQLLDVPHRCWSQEVLEKLEADKERDRQSTDPYSMQNVTEDSNNLFPNLNAQNGPQEALNAQGATIPQSEQ